MPEPKARLVAAWRSKAEDDLAVARLLIRQERRLHGAAAYHCQQAAEKMFKAWLTDHAVGFPKTHDLELLLHLCTESGARFSGLENAARELTPLATEFRYPGDIETPSPEDAARALSLAETVLERIAGHW
jgi:HEPN domain-containing protein